MSTTDVESPLQGAAAGPTWSFGAIQWGTVVKRQDYANLLMSACFVVVIVVVNSVATPYRSIYYLYDGTISYPGTDNFKPTIPSWAAVVVPLIMLIATVVVGELVYSRRQHKSVTDAVATLVYFILDGIQSFIFGLVWTVIIKLTAGGRRPDFLARCQPQGGLDNAVTLAFGTNPDPRYPCTNPDAGVVSDGFKSFPSGHTSTSFNLTVYAFTYLCWAWHMRQPSGARAQTFRQEFLDDLRNVLAKLWSLCMLSFAWGVAVSRTIDNQHHFVDVLGGMFLGTMVALVYALRAIPRYQRVLSPQEGGAPAKA